tara:strand:- start:13 stop:207 length:195 start_codon:yes stop_codon:yes gene_type:complete
MSDYQTVRSLLIAEQRRQNAFYLYKPHQRQAAMQKVASALAALDRLHKAAEWKKVDHWWQDKFD